MDTRVHPPRAIWVHPYEDEQFRSEHPELRSNKESDLDAPPSYDVATGAHTSDSRDKSDSKHSEPPDSTSGSSSHTEHKRGVFGKLKDKAIGTKEEREEQRRIRAEQAAQAEEQARQARMQQLEEREAYMRAHGGYAPYHPSYAGQQGYYNQPAQRPGMGLDNPAAFLLGGLAGGLLLGDIFGGF